MILFLLQESYLRGQLSSAVIWGQAAELSPNPLVGTVVGAVRVQRWGRPAHALKGLVPQREWQVPRLWSHWAFALKWQ